MKVVQPEVDCAVRGHVIAPYRHAELVASLSASADETVLGLDEDAGLVHGLLLNDDIAFIVQQGWAANPSRLGERRVCVNLVSEFEGQTKEGKSGGRFG